MKIEPYSNALGARVTGIDLSRTIPSDVFEELYQAYLDHLLLVFHEQPISDENLISLAKRFGDLRMPPAAHERASAHPKLLSFQM
jgi:taurine dioxygenase